MSREVRRVPPGWQHPKDYRGQYVAMHDGSDDAYAKRARAWMDSARAWDDGTDPTLVREPGLKASHPFFWEWDGGPPEPERYMPSFSPDTATHFMMYETCSEGTPISPAFATIEELARWLADNGASAFGSMTATYEQWLATCRAGWAPSAVFTAKTGLISGVAADGVSA